MISVFGMEKNQINRNWCEYRAKVCNGISTRLRVLSGVQNLLEDRDSVSRQIRFRVAILFLSRRCTNGSVLCKGTASGARRVGDGRNGGHLIGERRGHIHVYSK